MDNEKILVLPESDTGKAFIACERECDDDECPSDPSDECIACVG